MPLTTTAVLESWKIDPSWTLFMNRDGTICKILTKGYVSSWEAFRFQEGALDAIPILNKVFGLSIIVTDQESVGQNLMPEKKLRQIHVQMLEEITLNGGYIDEIYYCTDTAEVFSERRKPELGMAIQAIKDFPSINLRKSIMVGKSLEDLKFGKNAGMKTILLTTEKKVSDEIGPFLDLRYTDLYTFALDLLQIKKLPL